MPMKPVTRRRVAPQQKQEEVTESILDVLARNAPDYKEPTAATDSKKQPDVAELLARLDTIQQRLDESERANIALTTAAPRATVTAQPPQFNVEGLPDPVTHPQEYAAELAKRQHEYGQAYTKYQADVAAASAPQGDANALWEDFTDRYGAYAEDQEGVEFAVSKALKKAQARGMDIDKYRFQNSDRFFRDVVAIYDERFGKPEGLEPEPKQQQRKTTRQPIEDEDGDDGRASSIFGGSDASGIRAPAPPKPGDMLKDIQDIQRKTGYF